MSKQYMTIRSGYGDKTVTVRTNSEKAIKNALGKLRPYSNGTVKSFVIKGDVIEFEATSQKEKFGYWKPTSTYRAVIVENTFVTEAPVIEETAEVVEVTEAPVIEETAEVVEVTEAPVIEETAEVVEAEVIDTEAHTVTMTVDEKRAAWDIFVTEWAKSRAAYVRGEALDAEAPARIVEDVDTSYDDDAIDEALDAIRDAIISGQSYAHLIETAQDLGATRHAISEVIADAKSEATA